MYRVAHVLADSVLVGEGARGGDAKAFHEWRDRRNQHHLRLQVPTSLQCAIKSSFSTALICTARRPILASGSTNQGPRKAI